MFIPRISFSFPTRAPSYFLGHMAKSLRDLPTILQDIDLVIEARDARVPLSGINPGLERAIRRAWGPGMQDSLVKRSMRRLGSGMSRSLGVGAGRIRERVVVYTKRDLAEERYEEPLRQAFLQHANQKVFFANTNTDKDVKRVLQYAVQLARDNSAVMTEMKVLVVGMPNVGKSSLLNALRRVGVHKGKAFRTSSQPGFTRKLTGTVKIHSEPDIYVYDTPGVMVPYMGKGEKGVERGLKFALTTGIKEGLFEEEVVADYLLYLLNLNQSPTSLSSASSPSPSEAPPLPYLTALGLSTPPTNDLPDLLDALARRLGTLQKGGEPNVDAAMGFFLRSFREGKLGRLTVDDLMGREVGGGLLQELGRAEGVLGRDVDFEEEQRKQEEVKFSTESSNAILEPKRHTDLSSDAEGSELDIEKSPSDPTAHVGSGMGSQSQSQSLVPSIESDERKTRSPSKDESGKEESSGASPGYSASTSAVAVKSPSPSPETPASAAALASVASSTVSAPAPASLSSSTLSSAETAPAAQTPASATVPASSSCPLSAPSASTSPTPPTPAGSDQSPPQPQTQPRLFAQVSATVRSFLLDQSLRLDRAEETSQTQERKKEIQQKKLERAEKWRKKNPGAAAGLNLKPRPGRARGR